MILRGSHDTEGGHVILRGSHDTEGGRGSCDTAGRSGDTEGVR